MGNPVVHFEIIGTDPQKLRDYYRELFGWEFDVSNPVSDAVSEPDNYGFIGRTASPDGSGIPGGVGGGENYPTQALFYVGVEDVEPGTTRCRTPWWCPCTRTGYVSERPRDRAIR